MNTGMGALTRPRSEGRDPSGWATVERWFAQAVALPTAERHAFLAGSVRRGELASENMRQIQRLLEADVRSEGFIERAVEAGACALADAEVATERRFGRYRLVREIGRGGMSSVFLAVRDDEEFHKRVAVKVVPRGMDSQDIVRRFRTERQILASLDHPNIAKLYDGGTTEDGLPYFVMEYIEGVAVDRYCTQHQLTLVERLRLFQRICSAVHFAHQNLVVHRDLKPSNVLVTPGGVPKLLDFGIAKVLNPELSGTAIEPTRRAAGLMTLGYASPEQVRGLSVTTATDVYSLGVLLYELLTGRRPYRVSQDRPSQWETVICERPPEPPALGGDLDTIVLKALRKEPERRYVSVAQLSEDVERHLTGHPVSARADRLGYRAAKFIRRHRLGVGVAALFTVVVLGALIGMLVQASKVRQQRDRAEQVSAHLVELLEVAENSRNRQDSIAVSELLDRGAEIVRELAGQPESQAMLFATLGRTYHNIGRVDEAVVMFEWLAAYQRERFGADSIELADTRNKLGRTLASKGRYGEAEGHFAESYAIHKRVLGDEHPETVVRLNNVALINHDLGRYGLAEPLYRQVIEVEQRAAVAPEGRAMTVSNLALLYYDTGRYEAAVERWKEALALMRQGLGEQHEDVAETLDQVGRALLAQGRLAEASAVLTEAFEMRVALLGADHREVARSLLSLAWLRRSEGELRAAEELIGRSLEIRLAELGSEHSLVAESYEGLGELRLAQRQPEAAAEAFRRALEIYRFSLSEDHPLSSQSRSGLGRALVAGGDCQGALGELQEALEALPAEVWQAAGARQALRHCQS